MKAASSCSALLAINTRPAGRSDESHSEEVPDTASNGSDACASYSSLQ